MQNYVGKPFIIVREVKHRPQRVWVHKNSQIYAITKGDFIMGIRRVENMCGGKGHVIIKDILEGDELKGKCGLYAPVSYTHLDVYKRQKMYFVKIL